MTSETSMREALVAAMRRLDERGMNRGSAGNVSLRWGDGLLITPSGIEPGALRPEQLVPVDAAGHAEGRLKPSSEWQLHAAVYRVRADVQAVVHCHSRYATVLACARRDIPPFHYMVMRAAGRRVPCTGYETFGSAALATAASAALSDHHACLLANHGQLAVGADISEALSRAELVEELAAQYWGTLAIGGACLLNEEELQAVADQFRGYGQNQSDSD